MKNKKLIVSVLLFMTLLFCNLYSEQKDNLNKEVFHFDVSDATLTIEEQDVVKRIAQKMSCLNLKVLIESNTDITGTDKINVPLSQNRADVVKNYLISLGVSEDDIQVISYVSSNPMDTGRTPEAYSKNRRTEVTLIYPENNN